MLPYREYHEGFDERSDAKHATVFLNYCREAGNWVGKHWHPCLELLYVFGGEAEQTVNDEEWTFHQGDTLLISSGAIHSTNALEDNCYIGVAMFYQQSALPSLYLPAQTCGEMARLFSWMQEESTIRRPGYQWVVQGILFQILGLLERYATVLEPPKTGEGEGQRLEEYIRTHLTRGVSLQDAAKFAGYSPAYFSRYFPQLMGLSFKTYVDRMKMQAACGLLDDHLNVAETAAALCFETPSSFCRAFKRITGQTPREYQRQKMDILW